MSALSPLSPNKGHSSEELVRQLSILARSHELELGSVIDSVHKHAYSDLSQTALWKEKYRFSLLSMSALGVRADILRGEQQVCF